MEQIFGDFQEDLSPVRECLTLQFSPSSVPFKERWRTSGISADFIADYFANFFPNVEENGHNIRDNIKGTVSFIANELLENAIKFTDELSSYPISIVLRLYSSHLVFLATNSVQEKTLEQFQEFIQLLMDSDPSDLYFEWLEKNAKDDSLNGSGLGFLTMLHDYEAKVGWKFQTISKEPNTTIVTTMIQLTV